jgi:hypothetical protein
VAAVLLTCLAASAYGADTTSGGEPSAVRKLVRQLDAAELAKRDEAERQLIEIGPAALPLLPEVSDRQSAEFQQRLVRVRNRLQQARDREFVQGTSVTLQGEFPLSQVFSEIEKQTGNKLLDYRDQFGQESEDPTLRLDLNRVGFWQAIDAIMDQADLVPYPFADQQALAFVGLDDPEALRFRNADYVGAFRVEGTRLVADRDLREPRKHTLTLTLEVQWEPRLRPIAIVQAMEDVRATDDTDSAVDVALEEATFETPLAPGTVATELQVPLFPPSDQATMITSISGRLTALLPGGEESFEFTNLEKAQNVEQRQGGAVVVVERSRKNNDLWEVRIVVRYDDPAGALESHRAWVFNNEAYLVTADGQRHNPDGFETTRQTETEVGVAYLFDVADLAGAKFVYRTPTVIIQLPLEYRLADLPLP